MFVDSFFFFRVLDSLVPANIYLIGWQRLCVPTCLFAIFPQKPATTTTTG